ncbi:6-phosphogluconolactonase, cycloisomerase 2 family [Granulicella pectinivorans]|uniref:6-phosphogluconolactonase, cycloisomerase 2 family n=1 Tax=Granulicella pectinivorans TaxID=474950 RepID=A0A1I6M3U8_9BACT|nr:beta-propeller fold lactonase family protein [Granulicella pectinivorans]SFS10407.1 6-phosphogluconolactonase, cycloisomerase 2 family [Granulicella pectinivorans]
MIWTRRTFVSALSAAAVVAPKFSSVAVAEAPSGSFRAFVGASDGTVMAYRVSDGAWRQDGAAVVAASPRGLALHPTLPVLYATDAVDGHGDRPRGSVAAFRVTGSGLAAMNVEGMALSATAPSHLSVVDDVLLVSSAGGGAYNAFGLAEDGALLPVASALKQIGSGPHVLQEKAHPHASVAGELGAYASDFGSDRVNHLVFTEGIASVASRVSLPAGSGPGHLVLAGSHLVVASRLSAGLTVLPVDQTSGRLEAAVHALPVALAECGPLAVNGSGNRIYLAGVDHAGETVVASFGLSSGGRLRALQSVTVAGAGRPEQMVLAGKELLLAGAGGVSRIPVFAGRLGEGALVLPKAGAVSLVVG